MHLDLATNDGQRSLIDDFAREGLALKNGALIALSTRYSTRYIPLTICGDNRRTAQTDVCLLNRQSILLVLQKDTTIFSSSQPEAHVIAEAIAA